MKLASNEGAFGPLPGGGGRVRGRRERAQPLPGRGRCGAARRRWRSATASPPEQVIPGNGADELIRLCGAAVLDAGDAAVFPWPSFPSYVVAAAVHGAAPVQVPLRDRALRPRRRARGLRGSRPRAAAGCARCSSPIPTTRPEPCSRADEVRRLPRRAARSGSCACSTRPTPSTRTRSRRGRALVREGHGRLCVLRTFSKVYGLAALRVGYALASPDVADALDRVRPIFNLNQPAQEAALASLGAIARWRERVAHARKARGELFGALEGAGLDPIASQANFVYADVPGGRRRPAGGPAAPGGVHRPRPARLRRAGGDPGDLRHRCGERGVRRGARAFP